MKSLTEHHYFETPHGRISKVVSNWTGSAWSLVSTNRYAYDGWNLIAVLDASAVTKSFLWGLDLSGSMQGAGGVGGLLAIKTNGVAHFCAYDGNGNVSALVNSGGTNTANYEYGPDFPVRENGCGTSTACSSVLDASGVKAKGSCLSWGEGEVIRESGVMAKVNPFRFSTKYQDSESDLLYYGYRMYNPSAGRWLSRDPINELGFKVLSRSPTRFNQNEEKNLYQFVRNNTLRYCDRLGTDVEGEIVGRFFPLSWDISGNPAGTNGGWYAVHCAIHCWLSALRTQAGFDDGSNLALSGLHTVVWELIELESQIQSGGWGTEPWYDRLVDAYANTRGAVIGMKRCAPPKCSAWYGWVGRVVRDADKSRRCCDSACAALQPEFEGLAAGLRTVGETSEELWDILIGVNSDLTD